MRRLICFAGALGLMACGGSTEPSRALPIGTYTYATNTGLSGTVTITAATEDAVTATWDVRDTQQRAAFRPEGHSIGWNIDAFVVMAQPAQIRFSTHTHRLARTGSGISCSGTHVMVGPFTCTMTRR